MNSSEQAAARGLIAAGVHQHVIASLFQVNSGRVAEAKSRSEAMLEVARSESGYPVLNLPLIDTLCASAKERSILLHGVFDIDPEMGATLIDRQGGRNDGNRKFKQTKVRREFAPDMKNGKWLLNGDTIKLSDTGTLIDGQNRCMASTVAKVGFTTLVVFGVKRELFHTIDVGKPRSASDLFTIQGTPNADVVAGATRWVMIMRSKTPYLNLSFPPKEMLDCYLTELDTELMQGSVKLTKPMKAARKDISHSLLCGLHYAFAEVDRQNADRFFTGWAQADEWFRPLNLRLNELASRFGGKPRPINLTVGTIIQAWNIWRKGHKVRLSGRNSLNHEVKKKFERWS